MSIHDERTESIRLIRGSAASVANRSDLKRIRGLRFETPGFDRSVYQTMADMGWVGLTVPEEHGGAGLGMLEFCALAEEMGAALVPEPLILSAMTTRLLSGEALARVIAGSDIVMLAWQEAANSLDLFGTTTCRGGRLSGTKQFVPMAAGADAFLVTSPEGIALVAARTAGVDIETHMTQDGGHYGTLHLDNAAGEVITGDVRAVVNAAALATSAYLLGVIEAALSFTLDYLKTRQQFGKPIGSFQSLQHRAVDLRVQMALTRASIESAATIVDSHAGPSVADAAISRAKVRASEAAMLVTRQAIQMHGGIGYTDEAEIGLFMRKAMVLASAYGPARSHRSRYAQLALDTEL